MSDILDEAANYQPYNAFKDGPLVARLAAEIARLRAELAKVEGERNEHADFCAEAIEQRQAAEARALAAEAKVEEMGKALEMFVNHYPMGVNSFLDDAYRRARAALQPKEPT
jgi:acyl-homoserine lactone acylase PvdQ